MLGCTQAATMNELWHLTEPFKLVFRTTGSDETVTIPCINIGVFRAWIDWGARTAACLANLKALYNAIEVATRVQLRAMNLQAGWPV